MKKHNADSVLLQFALFATASMTVLGGTIIAPSLPNLELYFASIPHIDMLSRLVLTLPALFIMIFAPLSGFLLDKFGRLKFVYPAIVVWSISGSCAFLLESSIYLILVSRCIFGISTAFIMTGISALIGDYYQGAKRERALGLQGFFMAGGGALFLVLGGLLSEIDWRYPFLVYLSGLVIFFIAVFNLFEPQRALKSINTQSSDEKFEFLKLLPIYLFSVYAMSMFYVIPTQIPHFIVHNLQKGGEIVGLSLAVSSVCTAIISLLYARLKAAISMFRLHSISLLAIGIGFLSIGIFHNYAVLLVSLVLIGSGLGIILVNNNSWLLSVAKDTQRAKAAGFLSASVFMGQFASPFITQPLVRFGGIEFMFISNAIILLLSAVIFLCLKSPKK